MKRLGLWAALLGAIAIGYEVVWFRVLSAFFDATTYAFTLLLAIFLVGLAAGGAISVRLLRRNGDASVWLPDVQAALAWTALLAFVALGLSRGLSQELRKVVGEGMLWMAIHAGVVMLVPATLVGMSFPLLIHLATRADRAGADVGRVYALNTAGGIASSLAFGFALIPWLGTQRSNALLCLASAGAAVALGTSKRKLHGISVGLLAVCLLLVPKDFFVHAQVGWPDAVLLEAREGRDGILAAMEYTKASVCGSGLYACPADCPDFAHRRLAFGSISYASTTLPARRYMRMEGHLPMMFAAEPKRALQVCFGTGTTAGALAAWPQLEHATIVDLNPDVIDFARHFTEVNAGVLQDPRFEVVIDDGRHFLLATDRTFDVVSFEPPPPRAQGVVNLYSREFYALVKQHLSEGGVVAQWLPMDQQSMRLNRELAAAAMAEFAHVALFVPSRFHGVLLASRQPLVARNAWAGVPALKASFEDVGFASDEDVMATFVAGDEGLRKLVGDALPVTDDRPSIEHFLGALDAPVTAGVLQAISEAPAGPKTEAQWKLVLSTQRQNEGDSSAARTLVEEAEALAGQTRWTRYLHDITYGCLAPK